ncbi:MAG: hypothetical protein QGH24_04875 [Candidatus Marinimicrobia bacterium]|jgi:hypothetical protein|nr:hypothetical protein [Candidatus Neomarinimicrobiota bacterium]
MQKKKDRITSLITFGLFLVFVGALIYQTLPEKKTNEIVFQDPIVESLETEMSSNTTLDELPVDDERLDETETIDETTSFNEAFAVARAELGSGSTFIWNGNEYTTYLAEEVLTSLTDGDSLLAERTLNPKEDFSEDKSDEIPIPTQVSIQK